jgi:transposase-like protein
MKIGSCICPACSQESLIKVIGKVGVYWRCVNQKCGQTFCLEQLHPTDSDNAISNRNMELPEDHLEACRRYRIPTTMAGQIYELHRMFRL